MDSNSFNSKRIAAGYANDRPFIHSRVIDIIKSDLKITDNFTNGIDIGCGAGLSSKALKLICEKVTGVDISEEMVAAAKDFLGENGYCFFQSKAEEIPVPPMPYDIATAAGVIPWVDRKRFLSNAEKLLSHGAPLIIYDFWITDRMSDDVKHSKAYTDWWHDEYLKNYPKPPRNEGVWTNEDISPYEFRLETQKDFELTYKFDKIAFVKFMLTQSNVNAKIEGAGADKTIISEWFDKTLEPVFDGAERQLVFAGYYWYLIRK